jgi:flagellar biosynthesis anti-sigma factor FlgM
MKVEHTLDRLAAMKQQEASKAKEAKEAKQIAEARARGANLVPVKKAPSRATRVDISDRAVELGGIQKAVRGQVDENAAKIAKIKQLIADKKYKIPAEKIADKMVDEHLKTEMS